MKTILTLAFALLFSASYAQTALWATTAGGDNLSLQPPAGTAMDPLGNIIVVGGSNAPVRVGGVPMPDSTLGGYVIKYSPNGHVIWARSLGDAMSACKVDAQGYIYAGGTRNQQPYACKLRPNGDTVWTIVGANAYYSPSVVSVDYDDNGNMYVFGSFGQQLDLGGKTIFIGIGNSTSSFFITKINTLGQVVWLKGSDGQSYVKPGALYLDKLNGDMYLAGYFVNYLYLTYPTLIHSPASSGTNRTMFLAKMDSARNYVWINIDSGGSDNFVHSLARDSRGNLYATGQAGGTFQYANTIVGAGSAHNFIIKTAPDGQPLWATGIGLDGCWFNGQYNGVAIDKYDRVYTFSGNDCAIQFPDGTTMSGKGYLARWDTAGHFVRATSLGPFLAPRHFTVNNGGGVVIAAGYPGIGCVIGADTLPQLASNTDEQLVVAYYNTPTTIISGHTYYDSNNNGVPDVGEAALPGIMTHGAAGDFFSRSDSAGHYRMWIDSGSYQLSAAPPRYWTQTQPAALAPYAISAPDSPTVLASRDFGFRPVPGIADARISVTNVTPSRTGQNMTYVVRYANDGTDTLSGTVMISIDAAQVYVGAAPAASSQSGGFRLWPYSSLVPGEQRSITIYTQIPWTTPFNTMLEVFATITHAGSDTTPVNNTDVLSMVALSAFDPNVKSVSQARISQQEVNSGNTPLRYKIEFQNTGNDTAINVTLTDTISHDLDLSTFRVISSSNPVDVKIKNGRLAEFTFYNIMLPDSGTNEPRSHGYVMYDILPVSGTPAGETIHNFASIYFDFNAPVATNDAPCEVYLETGLADIATSTGISIWPNPNNGSYRIEIPGDTKDVTLTAADMLGRVVYSKVYHLCAGQHNIPVQMCQVVPGAYLITVSDGNTINQTRKIIVE